MELYRIAVRAVFAYVFLHVIIRTSGNKTIGQASAFDFVLAVVLGDMVDDLLWTEVPASQFVVGIATLALTELFFSILTATQRRQSA